MCSLMFPAVCVAHQRGDVCRRAPSTSGGHPMPGGSRWRQPSPEGKWGHPDENLRLCVQPEAGSCTKHSGQTLLKPLVRRCGPWVPLQLLTLPML